MKEAPASIEFRVNFWLVRALIVFVSFHVVMLVGGFYIFDSREKCLFKVTGDRESIVVRNCTPLLKLMLYVKIRHPVFNKNKSGSLGSKERFAYRQGQFSVGEA